MMKGTKSLAHTTVLLLAQTLCLLAGSLLVEKGKSHDLIVSISRSHFFSFISLLSVL